MSSTMLRRCLTAAVALAALAAVVALAPVSSAEAGPEVSPFAGTYNWTQGEGAGDSWAVTISDNGQITGSLVSGFYLTGSIKGRVSDDGSYSFTMSVTGYNWEDYPGRRRGPQEVTYRFSFAGNMAPDADGNMVGTPDTGGSFVWLRQ